MLPIPDDLGRSSLWSVNADGSNRTLLVDGAEIGAWNSVQN
jgi:hypothetical protein